MPIDFTILPHTKELSPGFNVRRLLPSAQTQGVGPFLFFDHFGPVEVAPGANHDVRPHPHIGLATVTYLFEGAMLHRDSLGEVQRIEPGAVNLMTAGRGIVHSERIPEDLKQTTYHSHGLQLWMALPATHEECEPMFSHTPAREIPQDRIGSAKLRVLMGNADAHFVLIGGDAIDGHRIMSWNFVGTRKELITKAAADWDADLFAKVPGETERIPLPDSLRVL